MSPPEQAVVSDEDDPTGALARARAAERRLRDAIVDEFGVLGPDRARRAGLLGLRCDEVTLYPAFQVDEHGQPLPVIAQLRAIAVEFGREDTSLIQWLCSGTTYFPAASRRPVDHLRSDPERVLEIARAAWSVEW